MNDGMHVYVIHVSNGGMGFVRVGSLRAACSQDAAETWEQIAATELQGRIALAVKVPWAFPGPIDLVNNTGQDLRPYYDEIRASIGRTGALPAELADVFTLTRVPDCTPPRFRLDPA